MESISATPLSWPLAVSLTFSIRHFCLVILYWSAFKAFMNNTTKKLSLLDEIRSHVRRKGCAYFSEKSYCDWGRWLVNFHGFENTQAWSFYWYFVHEPV